MPLPKMQPVDSSAIARIGFDAEAEEAHVEFHDSDVYATAACYSTNSPNAESKGTFLNRVIQPGCSAHKL